MTAGAIIVVFFQGGAGRLAAIAFAAALWLGGWLLDGREWTRPAGEPVDIALLQGAIPQDEKWLVENRAATLEKYRDLNRQALGASIIVWPESAVPGARARGRSSTSRRSAASRRRADPT